MVQHLLLGFDQLPRQVLGGAVSIGNFDGVHRGHAVLVEALCGAAKQSSGPAVVVTFDPHPASVLQPERLLPKLTSLERRAELLAALGVDFVVVCPVDESLLRRSAADFFTTFVRESLAAKAVVEGPNFFFGRNREGDLPRLKQLCQSANMNLQIVPPEQDQGEMISSSRIRQFLAEGDIESANAMLTAPYQLTGRVSKGAQRGAGIGFPTANLSECSSLIPGHGVYAGQVRLAGKCHAAAIHLGPNPTFSEQHSKVEVHVLDFAGSLYGQMLSVDFVGHVRDIARFPSVEALRDQLKHDCEHVRTMVADKPSN